VFLVGVPALIPHPVAVGVALAAAGATTAWWIVLLASIRQPVTPDALLGRAYSASRMISWGVLPAGAAIAGAAAEVFGIRTVFITGAVVTLGVLVIFLVTVSAAELESAREPVSEGSSVVPEATTSAPNRADGLGSAGGVPAALAPRLTCRT
jgi:hypothetical protein